MDRLIKLEDSDVAMKRSKYSADIQVLARNVLNISTGLE